MTPQEYRVAKFAKNDVQHCWMCRCELTYTTATVDHLKPKSKGGRNKRENFRLACHECNEARGNRRLTRDEKARALGKFKPQSGRYDELAAAIRRHQEQR
jgi:5-methylcytosine-specific restriction endonuclease McrA